MFSFYLQTGIMLTLISSIVFNKLSFIKIENKDRFAGSYLIQLDFIHSILSFEKSIAVIFPFFTVVSMENNSGGYNFYKVFIESLYNITFNNNNKFLSHNQRKKLFHNYLIFVFNWTRKIRTIKNKFTFNFKFSYLLILIRFPFIGYKILIQIGSFRIGDSYWKAANLGSNLR
jgi:hypothetical protein